MLSLMNVVSILGFNRRMCEVICSTGPMTWICHDDTPFNVGDISGQTEVTLADSGVITVEGAGMMNCRKLWGGFPWKDEPSSPSIKSITADGTFISIEANSFRDIPTLESVDLSGASKLLMIDSYAFYNCANLRSVTLCGTLEGIMERAFSQCVSLEHVNLVESDSLIGLCDFAFSECHSLTEFVVPRRSVYVGNGCFSGCGSLASFTYSGDGNSKTSTVLSLVTTVEKLLGFVGSSLSKLGIGIADDMKVISNRRYGKRVSRGKPRLTALTWVFTLQFHPPNTFNGPR